MYIWIYHEYMQKVNRKYFIKNTHICMYAHTDKQIDTELCKI